MVEELLIDVKRYLHITWEDYEGDLNLTGIINRGMARIQQISGATLNFALEDMPKMLLLDYCRYANSHALEMFEKNFQSELLSLHIKSNVDAEVTP